MAGLPPRPKVVSRDVVMNEYRTRSWPQGIPTRPRTQCWSIMRPR